jgi:hypothetical protein
LPAGRHPPVDRRPARLAGTRSKLAILTSINDAEAVACQWPTESAYPRPLNLPSGGHRICPPATQAVCLSATYGTGCSGCPLRASTRSRPKRLGNGSLPSAPRARTLRWRGRRPLAYSTTRH